MTCISASGKTGTTTNMARPHSMIRTLCSLLLLGVMIAVFIPLGNWQLRRADERKGLMRAIEAGQHRPSLPLAADTPKKTMQDWRPASASGVWLNKFTVLLQNGNYKGRPGYWVATPLLIDPNPRARKSTRLKARQSC